MVLYSEGLGSSLEMLVNQNIHKNILTWQLCYFTNILLSIISSVWSKNANMKSCCYVRLTEKIECPSNLLALSFVTLKLNNLEIFV